MKGPKWKSDLKLAAKCFNLLRTSVPLTFIYFHYSTSIAAKHCVALIKGGT